VVSSDDEESLAKWVKRRVLNTFSHAQRAKIRRGARSEGFATAMQDYEGAWMNPHSQAELGEMRSKLMAAASQLSPLRQQVFLQLYEGRPQQEIAAKLGVQYQTVRKHASEIYALLREAMASYREDWRPSKPSWYSTEPAAPEAK
jgi:RNA polymerase sigma factor (sigma-70 family)